MNDDDKTDQPCRSAGRGDCRARCKVSHKLYLKPVQLMPVTDHEWLACFLKDGEYTEAFVVSWALCEVWEHDGAGAWNKCMLEPGLLDSGNFITAVVVDGKELTAINPRDEQFLGYITRDDDAHREPWWEWEQAQHEKQMQKAADDLEKRQRDGRRMNDAEREAVRKMLSKLPHCSCGKVARWRLVDGQDVCRTCFGEYDEDAIEVDFVWERSAAKIASLLDAGERS